MAEDFANLQVILFVGQVDDLHCSGLRRTHNDLSYFLLSLLIRGISTSDPSLRMVRARDVSWP